METLPDDNVYSSISIASSEHFTLINQFERSHSPQIYADNYTKVAIIFRMRIQKEEKTVIEY